MSVMHAYVEIFSLSFHFPSFQITFVVYVHMRKVLVFEEVYSIGLYQDSYPFSWFLRFDVLEFGMLLRLSCFKLGLNLSEMIPFKKFVLIGLELNHVIATRTTKYFNTYYVLYSLCLIFVEYSLSAVVSNVFVLFNFFF